MSPSPGLETWEPVGLSAGGAPVVATAPEASEVTVAPVSEMFAPALCVYWYRHLRQSPLSGAGQSTASGNGTDDVKSWAVWTEIVAVPIVMVQLVGGVGGLWAEPTAGIDSTMLARMAAMTNEPNVLTLMLFSLRTTA